MSLYEEKDKIRKFSYIFFVGSLMYTMVCTRPVIAHVVGAISIFLTNPRKEHWLAVKWILGYLKDTSKVSMCYRHGEGRLEIYTDANMIGDRNSKMSTLDFVATFAGGAVARQSRLQKYIILSTTYAEYITIIESYKEMLWLKKFLQKHGVTHDRYTVYCDSMSVIHLGKNLSFHSISKHIDARCH